MLIPRRFGLQGISKPPQECLFLFLLPTHPQRRHLYGGMTFDGWQVGFQVSWRGFSQTQIPDILEGIGKFAPKKSGGLGFLQDTEEFVVGDVAHPLEGPTQLVRRQGLRIGWFQGERSGWVGEDDTSVFLV